MEAPQNLQISGLTSKIFYVQFIHKIQTENFQLFIESILSDLMDAIGDTFKVRISLYQYKDCLSTYNKSTISLVFPEYQWLSDVGIKISKFVKKHDEFMYVTFGISDQECSSYNHNCYEYVYFSLIAKDGVYIEKQMTSINMTLHTINDNSWCHGQQVPDYKMTTNDF